MPVDLPVAARKEISAALGGSLMEIHSVGFGSELRPSWTGCGNAGSRRILLAGRSGEGLFSEHTSVAQAWRPELVFLPEAV